MSLKTINSFPNPLMQYKKLFGRVESWIFLFFLLHLWGIAWPPIEATHSWRQATGLMVARNYLEGNTGFFYPMTDETNGASGVVGMEFPILYYIQAGLTYVFGGFYGWGRGIHLTITTLGFFYFFALVRHFSSYKFAFTATIFLLLSAFFTYARKTMPDTACLSLMFMGGYFFLQAFRFAKWHHVILAFVFLSLGLLVKIAAVPMLAVCVFCFLAYRNKPKYAWVLCVPFLAMLPMFYWYFVWNPHLQNAFGNWYNLGVGLTTGIKGWAGNGGLILHHFAFHPFFSFIAMACVIWGIVRWFRHDFRMNYWIPLGLFVLAFVLYAFKSGPIFYTHDYYILPLVPVLCLFAAYALNHVKRFYLLILAFVAIESIANQQHDFHWNKGEAYKLALTSLADKNIPKNALVAVNGNSNPQELYFLHRKGWNLSDADLNVEKVLEIKKKGCKYLIIGKNHFDQRFYFEITFENQAYLVYRL